MSVKLNSAAGGSVTILEPSTASDYNVVMPPASGNVVVNPVPAGTSTNAPLIFTPGVNLATPVTGAIEYDGDALLFTPISTQRGIIPSMQFYSHPLVSRTGENSTANQSILGVGFNVTANTVYQFQGRFNFFKTAGATAHTMNFSWGGTATFRNNRIATNMLVQSSTAGYTPYSASRPIYSVVQEVYTSTVVTSSIANAFSTINLLVDGIFVANSSGTVIPQYALSAAPGGAYVHSAGNYLAVWPVAYANLAYDSAANVSIGTWA